MLAQWLKDTKKFFQDKREEESYLDQAMKNVEVKDDGRSIKFKVPKKISNLGIDFNVPYMYAQLFSIVLRKLGFAYEEVAVYGGVSTFSICNNKQELKLRELGR